MGHPFEKSLFDNDDSAFQAPSLRTDVLSSQYSGSGLAGDGAEHSRGPEAAFLCAKFRHVWLPPFRFYLNSKCPQFEDTSALASFPFHLMGQ